MHNFDLLLDTGLQTIDGFLTRDQCDEFIQLIEQRSISPARIGQGLDLTLNQSIRHAYATWLRDEDFKETSFTFDYFLRLQQMQLSLRDYFRVSLRSFESQYCFYPKGGHYKKHIDQIKNKGNRLFTMITYLNECEGGELIAYHRHHHHQVMTRIEPKPGLVVLLNSHEIYHEVSLCQSERYTLTTWFRRDELT